MARTVSAAVMPRGTTSFKNSPMISPCEVLISSPTITLSLPGATFDASPRSANAPSTVLWSVTAAHVIPLRRHSRT